MTESDQKLDAAGDAKASPAPESDPANAPESDPAHAPANSAPPGGKATSNNGTVVGVRRKRAISPIKWTPEDAAVKGDASATQKKAGQLRRRSRSRSPQKEEQQPPPPLEEIIDFQPQQPAESPPPEQPEQLRQLFRDARFFMIKSSNYENVSLAKAKGVWATPPPNQHRLNEAYHQARSVFLIFSVKESGRFQVCVCACKIP